MPETETVPKINDQYWFDRSEEMVSGSIERIDKASDTIKQMMLWAYGIYTASSIFTVEYKNIDEWLILLVLTLPYVLLIVVYWQTQTSQFPVDVDFDYRSPKQIREAYVATYQVKSKELAFLRQTSAIAMVSLAAALVLAYFLKNDQKVVPPEPIYLSAKVIKDIDSNRLLITGRFPADSVISVTVRRSFYDSTKKIISKDISYELLNTHEGVLQQTVSNDTSIVKVAYRVNWNDGIYKRSLEREISLR